LFIGGRTTAIGPLGQKVTRRGAMRFPKVRRRWVVLVVLIVLVIASIRALDRTMPIQNYQVVDQQTLAVWTTGGPGSWTRITSVVETPSSITIVVSTLPIPFVPSSDMGSFLELTVRLNSLLGNRVVVDGSSGQTLTLAPSPWPPRL